MPDGVIEQHLDHPGLELGRANLEAQLNLATPEVEHHTRFLPVACKTKLQTFNITSQSVTKFTKHSFRDGVVVVVGGEWWWKPILVYSSGPTFELELELESDLT